MASIKVKLGETEYDVPKMNIGQIEDMALLQVSSAQWTYRALEILMRRAQPPVGDIREIEAEPKQLRGAIVEIMSSSGYEIPDPKNLEAPDRNPGTVEN